MATGIYDFEGLAESANPVGNGWTLSASGSWTSQIVLGTTPVGTRFWRQTASSAQNAYLTWTSSGNPAWNNTIEILSLWRRADTNRPYRGSPAAFRVRSSPADAYYVSVTDTDDKIAQIRRRENATDTWATAGASMNVANENIGNDWHWVRFQLIWTGSTNELRAKYWRHGEEEPTNWRDGPTSRNALTETQTFGMMPNFTASGQQQDIAWFSVGTGTDSAPGPQEDTGLAFTTAPTVTSRTTESYTIGGTTNQDCTVFAVATATTAADPDGPQIAAGTDGDDVAAPGTGSVAATADMAFSLNITGTFTEATHDIHIVARREAE
jgi:hypothetical protein